MNKMIIGCTNSWSKNCSKTSQKRETSAASTRKWTWAPDSGGQKWDPRRQAWVHVFQLSSDFSCFVWAFCFLYWVFQTASISFLKCLFFLPYHFENVLTKKQFNASMINDPKIWWLEMLWHTPQILLCSKQNLISCLITIDIPINRYEIGRVLHHGDSLNHLVILNRNLKTWFSFPSCFHGNSSSLACFWKNCRQISRHVRKN